MSQPRRGKRFQRFFRPFRGLKSKTTPTRACARGHTLAPLRGYGYFALSCKDQPMRALLLVHVETLAVVAPDALARNDFRPANGSPLALLFADLAGVAFRPALDPKHCQVR